MNIYQLLVNLIEKPEAYKVYKDLCEHYKDKSLLEEHKAFSYLIEKRFNKKNEIISNDTNIN